MDEEAPPASEEDDEDWLAAEIATGLTFASSDAVMLTEAKGLHPMARSIAVLVIVLLMLCGAIVLILRASKRNADAQAHHAPLGGQSFESARSFRNGSVQGSSDGNIYGAPSLGASTQSEYDVGDIK